MSISVYGREAMKTREFLFDLPRELIAQFPVEERGESRLMTVDRKTGRLGHHRVRELPNLLPAGTLAVFNDSRVRKARIHGMCRDTGGVVEFLLLGTSDRVSWRILSNRTRRLKPGRVFLFPDVLEGVIEKDCSADRVLRFSRPVTEEYLDLNGRIPLPPYIRRKDTAADADRYQTVYAGPVGSIASPTAGLHFTPEILSALDSRGVRRLTVTLHVGLGTFLPVRSENIEEHRMHEEEYLIEPAAAEEINREKALGCPLLAVGTTSIRVLESAWKDNGLESGEGRTSIFIYPGYRFQAADLLFTNFHTPESTLLMLVSAFAGKELIDNAYGEAVKLGYRFFSYGDAMLIY